MTRMLDPVGPILSGQRSWVIPLLPPPSCRGALCRRPQSVRVVPARRQPPQPGMGYVGAGWVCGGGVSVSGVSGALLSPQQHTDSPNGGGMT